MTTLASPTQGDASVLSMWQVDMRQGQRDPDHTVDSEQIWHVTSGELAIAIEQESMRRAAGDTLVVPEALPRRGDRAHRRHGRRLRIRRRHRRDPRRGRLHPSVDRLNTRARYQTIVSAMTESINLHHPAWNAELPSETGTLRAVGLAQHAGASRLAANLYELA
jgi:hypothetical protein